MPASDGRNLWLIFLSILVLVMVGVVLWMSLDLQKIKGQLATINVNQNVDSTTAAVHSDSIADVSQSVPDSSLSALLDRVSSLENQVEKLQPPLSTGAKTVSTSTSTASNTGSSFQKETIYLGSTSTNSREWTETGLEVGINSAHYPTNVKVKLEAGLSIIGGEAWVRLKNKSTGAVIPLSEISHNTSTTTWKTSPSFELFSGGYTYVLEARSTSGETAIISGTRVILER